MARAIDRDEFQPADYERFSSRVLPQLAALELLLDRPGFGEGATTIGAELELALIGESGRALPVNRSLIATQNDPRLGLEIDRFNLEYNLAPLAADDHALDRLEADLGRVLGEVGEAAQPFGGRVVAIGILPTLTIADLRSAALTDVPRYRALSRGMRRLRGAPFQVRIAGEETLTITSPDIALEGANTSFQLHLRVEPARFAATYNAAQLATPIALAVCGNSPIFLGHRLWDETRIALFKQSLDERERASADWRAPSRVSFGHGWVRRGAWELFAESVALYPPLFPLVSSEDSIRRVRDGGIPHLDELRLHQGTVWRWNRAIYDPGAGGHLRVEMRALPAGPTPADMVANGAFLLGLTVGLRDEIDRLVPTFPFRYAEYDFYRTAQRGLDARILWPRASAPATTERPVRDVVRDLLPVAERGLELLGMAGAASARALDVIRARLESDATPARWQRRVLDKLGPRTRRAEALARMLEAYVREAALGRPVHEWSDAA